jgi:AcrR family transcriptional regulator
MSSESSQALQDDDTKSVILNAALELLTTEGHESLTIRRVAAKAGCSTIGVYTWFGGKDGLIEAIWVEGFASFARALRKAKDSKKPLALLNSQAVQYRKWALSNPMYYQVMFLRAVPGFVPSSDAAERAGSEAFGELLKAVTVAAERGELAETDHVAVAMSMWAAVHGLVSLELITMLPPATAGERKLADRSFELAVRVLTRGLSGALS